MTSTLRLIKELKRVAAVMLAATSLTAYSQTDIYGLTSRWSYQVGVDAWKLGASIDKDPVPGFNEANSNLLLPNSYTAWSYRNVSPYGRLAGIKRLSNDLSFSLKVRADQSQGLKINEASLEKEISPTLVFRLGVVDYKTSWCKTYEADNGWIQDIEAFCVTPQFRDVSGGAPGVQVVTNTQFHDYQIQTLAGLYNPLLLNYAPKEFGNVVPSPQYSVTSNKKAGFNVNILDLTTSIETRISFLQAHQEAYSPEAHLIGTTKQAYDLWYLGLNIPTRNPNLSVRLTHVPQSQKSTCRSSVAQLASACNRNSTSQKHSSSAQVSYRHSTKNLFSFGISDTEIKNQSDFFTPDLQVFTHLEDQFYIKVQQASAAWRHDWNGGFFTVIQYIKAKQNNGQLGIRNPSDGYAVGLRLGYQY
jgi:hypothetical protein